MSATSGKQLAVGLRGGIVFFLTTTGYPAAISTSVYKGLPFEGPKAFTLNVPDARKITHIGKDRVLALDYLPPIEGMTGEIRVSANDQILNSYLTNVKQFPIGETEAIPWNTDQQGFEPTVALLLFQQSLDLETKIRRWHFYLIPSARVIPSPSSMDDNAGETKYVVAPNPTSKHLWGTAFTQGIEGCLSASLIDGMSENIPSLVAWKGDNTLDTFLFPVTQPAITGKVKVWVDGIDLTSTSTITSTSIELLAPPADGAHIVAYYERLNG